MVAELSLFFKLICNQIICQYLLGLMNLRVRSRASMQRLFELDHEGRNYRQLHSLIPRMMRLGNEICAIVDFLVDSLGWIRNLDS